MISMEVMSSEGGRPMITRGDAHRRWRGVVVPLPTIFGEDGELPAAPCEIEEFSQPRPGRSLVLGGALLVVLLAAGG